MNILAIDHIQLAMPRGKEEQARGFYSEILGLKELEKPEPLRSRGGCWFTNEAISIHLGVEEDFRPAKKAHPAFRVADLAATAAHFTERSIIITEDTSLPNVHRFYVSDPFGNRLEFIQDGDYLKMP